ncbi:MAG: polyisoprenoid-binding protein [Flavobacteriales bacterium]|nr:polyisoprenoid-binding protein [Flavobacteriales bacterium]|tara:strand:- start:578 stop:1129 length:552 start_codon:yes stop_codon:yes gene_type:complete
MNTIKKLSLALIGGLFCLNANAQKYMTQNGTIQFFSETPVENIEAVNNQVSSVIDMETGNLVFKLLMKAFTFEKALMQEHFNEKYVESEKFPRSTFKGQIKDFDKSKYTEGKHEVIVVGELTIHGVTQKVEAPGTIEIKGDQLIVNSTFTVEVADYEIKIPSTVSDNIAKTIEIQVEAEYDAM